MKNLKIIYICFLIFLVIIKGHLLNMLVGMVHKSMPALLTNQKPKLANPCYYTLSLLCVEHGYKPLSIFYFPFSAFALF